MSHIVIHDDADGVTHYQQFADLTSTIGHVKTLRNHNGIDHARLFELQKMAYKIKTYFKVELPALTAGTSPVETAETVETTEPPEILPTAADTEMVFETAGEPIEASATLAPLGDDASDPLLDEDRLTSAGGDSRRGLFGR